MKQCIKCGDYKSLDNFTKRKDTKSTTYRPTCKTCMKEIRSKEYHTNIAENKRKAKLQYRRNRKQRLEASRLYYRNNTIKVLLANAKRRSRQKGIPFNLEPEDLILPTTCPVLDIPMYVGEEMHDGSPTLDRYIPEKGYVIGNVNIISNKANRLKNDGTLEEIDMLLKWMKDQENKDG